MHRPATPVSTILKRKGDWVISIDRTATVFEAIQRMVKHNVGAIVVKENGDLCGIFTERDYLRRIALEGRTSRTTHVEEVMTSRVVCVNPSTTVEECMQLMTKHHCRHLPVVQDPDQLVGILSIGDCVRLLSQQAESEIEDLTSYIAGVYPA